MAPTLEGVMTEATMHSGVAQVRTGEITFEDSDTSDRPLASTSGVTLQAYNRYGNMMSLTSAQQASIKQAFTLSQENNTNEGSIDWSYEATSSQFNFLSSGEKVRATFTVSVDDGEGGVATENVVVNIHGHEMQFLGTGGSGLTPTVSEGVGTGTIVGSISIDNPYESLQSLDYLAAYDFEYGSLYDSVNNRYATSSAPNYTVSDSNGNTNGARSFSGSSSDYVDLPDITLGSEFSFSANVRYDNLDTWWGRIFDLGNGPALTIFYCLRCKIPIILSFQVFDGSQFYGIDVADVLVPGQWLHIAGTVKQDGTISLYVNGQLRGQATGGGLNNVTLTSNYLGKSNWSDDGMFEGAIQDVVFVDEALSANQISLLANTRERVSDIIDSPEYRLIDNADGRFSIDSEGVIRVAKPELLHDGLNPTHDIKVSVTYPDGEIKTETFTIDITDDGYNDAPSMSDLPETPIA